MLSRSAYLELLAIARVHARSAIEADDLLQEALLAALMAGRELSARERGWFYGTMRNLSAMAARSAARRHQREKHAEGPSPHWGDSGAPTPLALVAGLGPSLRSVALLVLAPQQSRGNSGHLCASRTWAKEAYIRHPAAWSARETRAPGSFPSLTGADFGSIRRRFCRWCAQAPPDFASHHPTPTPMGFRISAATASRNERRRQRRSDQATRSTHAVQIPASEHLFIRQRQSPRKERFYRTYRLDVQTLDDEGSLVNGGDETM